MSTPNPVPNQALVAAVPTLIQALGYLKAAVTTILTGEAALLPARIAPAIGIMDNQIVLLAPGLFVAEEGVALTDATSGIDGLIAKLTAIAPAASKG